MNRPIDTYWEKKKPIWTNNSPSWKYNKYVDRFKINKNKTNKQKENHKTTHNQAVYNQYKRSVLRATREKKPITYKVIRIEMAEFLIRNTEDQKTVEQHL